MGTLGRTHIFLATVGVAVFTLAAVLAVMYLIEDRQLKRKRFGELIDRGAASLETLDRLAARCVSFGFPIFTVALVTGALWIARLGLLWGTWPCGPSTCWRWRPGSLSACCWWRASAGGGRGAAPRGSRSGGSAGRCWFW